MRKHLLLFFIFCFIPSSAQHTMVAGASLATQEVSKHFPETGHAVKGRFLLYWQEHGGLSQQGYPISSEIQEQSATDGKTYTVQYFERAVFEYHPENKPPYDVLLSLLGVFEYNRKYGAQGGPGQRVSTDSPSLFKETGKTLGGKFRRYWETHGGLPQQGYPISDEFQERSELDGKLYTVQYFERAVFEHHPENAGSEYEVLLSHLGKFQYARRHEAGSSAPTPTSSVSTVPAEATTWLREHAIPLRTTEPTDDFSDLMHLKEFIGNARIVSLGEASHGGREFFTMKHRLLRFLVKEMGFTMLAFEDGWVESLTGADYVETGRGSAELGIIHLLAWPWKSQEVIDMLDWMRAYNQGRGSAAAIEFQGFDMQSPHGAANHVITYLRAVDAPAADRAALRFQCLTASPGFPNYHSMPTSLRTQCRAQLQQAHDELTANRGAYEAASSSHAFTMAQFAARIVLQAEELLSSPNNFEVRDRYMAENIARLLEQRGPDAKVVVWAHNGHVGTVSYAGHEYPSMGMHLRQSYGDSMRIIGFDFDSGSFYATSGRLQVNTVKAAPQGSYGHYFHTAGIPLFFLDLRGIQRGSSATDWLVGPRRIWDIGHRFDPADPLGTTADVSLPQVFDGIIFIDKINPTTLR